MKRAGLFLLLAAAMVTSPADAGYYGKFYPKGQSIRPHASPQEGFGSSLYTNALGDSWNYPAWEYAYAQLRHTKADFLTLTTVYNRNLKVAITPTNHLGNFMNDNAFSYWLYNSGGYGQSSRYYGYFFKSLRLNPGTTIGIGVKGSRWANYHYSDALTSYQVDARYQYAYQPGNNPARYRGKYSPYAWVSARFIGPFSLNLPPLDSDENPRQRRSIIGSIILGADRKGHSTTRYFIQGNSSYTASVSSGVFLIPDTDRNRFLAGQSFSYYFKGSGWFNQEIRPPLGRKLLIVVRDGVNTNSCEGAQVSCVITQYK